jgi:hypothetical protein
MLSPNAALVLADINAAAANGIREDCWAFFNSGISGRPVLSFFVPKNFPIFVTESAQSVVQLFCD